MANRPVPHRCPSCGATPKIVRLECPACETEITGEFDLCPVCRLDDDLRGLFDLYIKSRGNLKRVERELGLSYPTVRHRIEELFRRLGHGPELPDPQTVLERLRKGEINVDAAERLLRGEGEFDTT